MRAQDILDAMSYIDEELIVDAERFAGEKGDKKADVTPVKPRKNKARVIAMWSAIGSAAIVLFLLGGIFILSMNRSSMTKDSSRTKGQRYSVNSEEVDSIQGEIYAADEEESEEIFFEEPASGQDKSSETYTVGNDGGLTLHGETALVTEETPVIYVINGLPYEQVKVDFDKDLVGNLACEDHNNKYYFYGDAEDELMAFEDNGEWIVVRFMKQEK